MTRRHNVHRFTQNYVKALLVLLSTVLIATGTAQAEDPKPKPKPDTPTEVIKIEFKQIELSYKTDGSPGPLVTLGGVLHLASNALLSDNGVPIGFRLHSNLSDASALSADGSASFVAVGASDGVPTECEPDTCAPPFWTFTFRLIPQGRQPSLLFDLMVSTQYDTNGALVDACIVGEEGCNDDALVP